MAIGGLGGKKTGGAPKASDYDFSKPEEIARFGKDMADFAKSQLPPITDDQIKSAYKTYLGREPAEEEVAGWRGVDPTKFDEIFQNASSGEIRGRLTELGQNYLSGNIPGYDAGLQERAIESQYGTAQEDLAQSLREQAAGGGFETGGYYTSVAKGRADLEKSKITTLADMNKALSEYKVNMSLKGAELLSGLENQKLSIKQYNDEMARYNAEMSDYRGALKKSQDNWWMPIFGATLGSFAGPIGAGIGQALGNRIAGTPGATEPAKPAKPVQPSYYQSSGWTGAGYSPTMTGKDYFSKAY